MKNNNNYNNAVIIKNLNKEFSAKQKGAGLKESIKSLIISKYIKVNAVNNISFTIKKGETVGFIGPNGAGKSTAIKMMTGILFPTKGSINVLGFNPQKSRKKLAMNIGTVFGQKPQLWYHLPAIDTFNLFAKIYELNDDEYKKRLNNLIDLFEVKEIINQPVRKLSLGQRMRCEIIASLLHKPKVLFLDEPTIGLDIVVKKRIRSLIKKLNKEEKTTVILTSHDMEDVEKVCKRLIIINQGKIVYDGLTKKIRDKYLSKKQIIVILEDKVDEISIKGAKTIFRGKFKHGLEIDTKKVHIKDVIQNLVSKYNLNDINIIDPPIEDIIEQIYNEK
jgi:ABC-2 type transport system ATP-binding protein